MFNQQAGIPLHSISIIHSCLLLSLTPSNQHSAWFVFGFRSCNCSSPLLKRKQTFTGAGLLPYLCRSMATIVKPVAFFPPCFCSRVSFVGDPFCLSHFMDYDLTHSLHILVILPVRLREQLRVMDMLSSVVLDESKLSLKTYLDV